MRRRAWRAQGQTFLPGAPPPAGHMAKTGKGRWMSLLQELLEHEHRVWRALVAGDAAADAALLAEDFVGLYPDGFADRAAHAGQLAAGPTVRDYCLSGARVVVLAPDLAILAYLASYRRPATPEVERMWVSSTWRRVETGWVNVFSQDTPCDPAALPQLSGLETQGG